MPSPKIIGMIPARLAATRLPDKPLLEIYGRPMIQWVWERARSAELLTEVYVATPDERIAEAVAAFGGVPIMTSHRHRSGTDRLAEAAAGMDADIIANIQGDEPLVDPSMIDDMVRPLLDESSVAMTSLMCPCPDEQLDAASTVKVVCDLAGNALYFSRARIPHRRAPEGPAVVMQHMGLYAYRRDVLISLAGLSASPLEQAECLEQLRAIENGYRIRMVRVERAPLSVDTPDDLRQVRAILSPQ